MPSVPQSNLVAVNNLANNLPESPAQVGLVIGPSTAGTVNSIIRDDSINAILSSFGAGPASEVAACALNEPSHGALYQIKTATSIPGTVGSVTKTTGASVGTAVSDFGSVLVPGADLNGSVLFTGKVEGAELEIVTGMATNVAISGGGLHVTVTVTAATTGTQLATLITGDATATTLWSPFAFGTGASVCGQSLSTFSETSGRIAVQALTGSMQYESVIVAPHPHARSVTLVGGTKIRVELGTNADAQPTSQAIQVQSDLVALAAANPGKFRTTLAGSGTGLLGVKALANLPFGSTGAMTVSGAPLDAYDVTIQIATAGGLGTASFRVSLGKAAGIPVYGDAVFLIPAGGSVAIPDTGLTLTFTGSFDAGDVFSFATTAPQSTLADVLSALTYFQSRPEQASLIAIAGEVPVLSLPAWIAALNSAANSLEAAKKYARILIEYAGPSSGQTNAAWASSVAGTLAAFAAPRLSLFGGSENTTSALPLPQLGRPEIVNGTRSLFARALALPSGVDVGDQTQSGAMTSVLSGAQTDVAATLAASRSSYLYLLPGVPGVQAEGLLFDSPTGDFTYLTYGRVLDEVMFYAYLRQTKYLSTAQKRNRDGTIRTSARLAIEKDLRSVLIDKIVKPGNASDVAVVVDGSNTDNRLRITYFVQVLYYIKRIDGRAGVVKTITATQTL